MLLDKSIKERLYPLKNKQSKNTLLVHEIYASLQGESSYMGYPCVFVRTTACHLRCDYCDTRHAFYDGKEYSLNEIVTKIESYNIPLVELTGGEPLLQKQTFELLTILADKGYTVLIETSGGVSIKNVDRRVKVILDVKTPDSNEIKSNVWDNLDIIWPGCEVKFVLCSLQDYDFAKEICSKYDLYKKVPILLSPVVDRLDPKVLADAIMKDKIQARMQLQLHRILWGEEKGK